MIPLFILKCLTDWQTTLKFFEDTSKQTIEELNGKGSAYVDIFTARHKDFKFVTLEHKFYFKENAQWIESKIRTEILAEKIPDEIRKKIDDAQGEVDITDEIKGELAARGNSAVAGE